MSRVLIVDEDPRVRALVTSVAGRAGFEVDAVPDVEEALQTLVEEPADLVIGDASPSGSQELSVLRSIRARFPDIPVVMMADDPTGWEDVLHTALLEGASDTLRKPLDERRLEAALSRLLADLEPFASEWGRG